MLLFKASLFFDDRSLVLRILFSLRKSSHTGSLPQNDVYNFTNVLPLDHCPRSNSISKIILIDHYMDRGGGGRKRGGGGG